MLVGHEQVREEQTLHVLVVATPGTRWRSVLPRFEQSGHHLPDEDAMERWRAGLAEGLVHTKLKSNLIELLERSEGCAVVSAGTDAPPHALKNWLDISSHTSLLLFHCRPETAVARGMMSGASPEGELVDWKRTVEGFLAVYRQNRPRVLLVDADQAISHASGFKEACWEKFGLKVYEDSIEMRGDSEEPEEIYRLIAAQMVSQSDEVQQLVGVLEASSIPLGHELRDQQAVDCETVFREVRKGKAKYEESERSRESLKQENELLLLQLLQVQEELEEHYLKLLDEASTRRILEEKLAARDATVRGKNLAIAKKEEKYQRVLQEKKQLDRKLAATSDRIDRIRNSFSWRITRPLRAVRKMISKRPISTGVA